MIITPTGIVIFAATVLVLGGFMLVRYGWRTADKGDLIGVGFILIAVGVFIYTYELLLYLSQSP